MSKTQTTQAPQDKDKPTIIIKAYIASGQIKNGRVKAGDKLHLDVSRIRRIFAWQRRLYIVYETDNVDYYKQYVEEPPPYAVELQYKIQKYRVDVCSKCGSLVEWDADEPYCPRGCDERYSDWSYHIEERERFVVEAPKPSEEVRQFIEKAFKVSAEFVASEFRNLAGGCRPLFKLPEVDFSLYQVNVVGIGVVDNPEFECSDYDSVEVQKRRYDGRYIAVRVAGTGFETLLYKFTGEPDLSTMQQLHEEYMAKKREEEERRRKVEEEIRRRMEEEERKWGDPQKVIEAIKAALPDWADGAVIVSRSFCSEDCDVAYYAYPVKRSNRGPGYYYSPEWRVLRLGVPERFLEKFADCVITRNGDVVKVKQEKNGGSKYVTLRPA